MSSLQGLPPWWPWVWLVLVGGGQGTWSHHGSRAQSLTGDRGGIFQPWHSFFVAAGAMTMFK